MEKSNQEPFLSIFYSQEDRPLKTWKKNLMNGQITRLRDTDMECPVLEMLGASVSKCYITTPIELGKSLSIKMPVLVLLVKSVGKVFTFEVQVLDDQNIRRRFRVTNSQQKSSVSPFLTVIPLKMTSGWNKIEINLAYFTKEAYGTNYVETVRLQVHPNVRIRRIFFSNKENSEETPSHKSY